MKIRLLTGTLLLGFALAGCTTTPQAPATNVSGAPGVEGMTRLQSRMCQVFRSYEDRAAGGELQEACTRQLGAQMCARCLAY